MNSRQVLVLGNLRGTAKAALEVARRDTEFEAVQLSRTDEAIGQLDQHPWNAVLVDLTTPGASRFCHEARARRALFNVPLIAMSPKLTDLAFANAFRWGADDVVLLGAAETLARRLRAIPVQRVPEPQASRGEAVIADPERGRCDVVGRVLANAGFSVRYATDVVSTRFYLSKPGIELFVLNTDLAEPLALLKEARSAGSKAQWVLTTKQRQVSKLRAALRDTSEAIVMSSHGPPENVLFALNLLRPSGESAQRAEVRALHGAVVLFRSVGEDHDEYGFTYSVSATGLYVRTLVPPPADKLWVEIQPPNMDRRVRLVARVAWTRRFGESGAETAPPGFGVQIVDGLGADLDLWLDGFNSLEVKAPAPHEVPEMKTSSGSFRIPLPSYPPVRSDPAMRARLRSQSSLPRTGQPRETREITEHAAGVAPESPETPSPSQLAIADALSETLAAKGLTASLPARSRRTAPSAEVAPDEPAEVSNAENSDDTIEVPSSVWQSIPPDLGKPDDRQDSARTSESPIEPVAATGSATTANQGAAPPLAAATILGLGVDTHQVQADASSPPQQLASTKTLLGHPAPQEVSPDGRQELNDTDLLSDRPDDRSTPVVAAPPAALAAASAAPRDSVAPPEMNLSPPAASAAGKPRGRGLWWTVIGLVVLAGGGLSAPYLRPATEGAIAGEGESPPSEPRQNSLAPHPLGRSADLPEPSSANRGPAARTTPLQGEGSVAERSVAAEEPAADKGSPSAEEVAAEGAPTEESAAKQLRVEAAPGSSADPPASPPITTLADDSTYVFVRSKASANVYVHGVEGGKTNEWIVAKCGIKFIRLGTALGVWVSKGEPHRLKCRSQNVIDLSPTEEGEK